MAKFAEFLTCELRRIPLLRLSEKSRRCPWCSSTDRREGLFRPISVFSLRPNQTSERCSDPFSDSLRRRILRTSPFGDSRKLVCFLDVHSTPCYALSTMYQRTLERAS